MNLVQLTTSISVEDFIRIDTLAKRAGKTRSAFVADRIHNDCMVSAEPVDQGDVSRWLMVHPIKERKAKKRGLLGRLFG